MIQKQKKLVEKSPIAAVPWASEQPDLEIRAFTVLASDKAAIAQFSHSNNWWSLPGPSGPYMESSAIACCRNTAPETAGSNPICVFYQPEPGRIVLAVFPADDSQISKDMAKGIQRPYGIPPYHTGERKTLLVYPGTTRRPACSGLPLRHQPPLDYEGIEI